MSHSKNLSVRPCREGNCEFDIGLDPAGRRRTCPRKAYVILVPASAGLLHPRLCREHFEQIKVDAVRS